jgi:hypothetical protein
MDKLVKEAIEKEATLATRRHFLQSLGTGIGSLAFGSALWNCSSPLKNQLASTRIPPHFAKAKSVIFLHMAGAPSQLELFDYKPILAKFDGKECPKELLDCLHSRRA